MNHSSRVLFRVAAPLLFLAVGSMVVDACPTCKDALSSSPNGMNIVRGYFWSILFMMSMPFLIFGSLAGYFYMEVRRARQTRNDHGPEQVPAIAGSSGSLPQE